jgi:methylated-DNA-[protein]-cysteine S-methyltransferase
MRGGRGIIETPIGTLAVGRRDGRLAVDWLVDGDDAAAKSPAAELRVDPADPEPAAIADAIRAYFAGDGAALARIPTGAGTDFQRRVWDACRTIPAGETRTYGWIAGQLGGGHALCRAVGQALRRNPLPIVVPCHRVVAEGGLGGYAGDRTGELARIKRRLLAFEARADA